MVVFLENGAIDGSRTHDLLITNQLLYQLSYDGLLKGLEHDAPERRLLS